jgi:SAM-dependent methyltransferase
VSRDDQKRWDLRHSRPARRADDQPRRWLKSIEHLLPKTGRALDLATGKGQDAVYLAALGLEVQAVDISPVGIAKVRELAELKGVAIETRLADLETDPDPIPLESYDLIICFRYMQRSLAPRVESGLKNQGIAALELVTRKSLERRPRHNPQYLVEQGELEHWLPSLTTMHFEEVWEGSLHLSRIVAKKDLGP